MISNIKSRHHQHNITGWKKAGIYCVMTGILILSSPTVLAKMSDEEKLMRKSGCFRCHAVKTEKKGPSYTETAQKYRGKDVMDKLYEAVTDERMVEVEGEEKKHKKLKTDDSTTIKAVINWILAH